ncbi:MAG: hypothetical protein IJR58_02030, partial [Lachnospiraceae bacterium]|nr:hypothetical protein [Lachnospiraceae bacterium]
MILVLGDFFYAVAFSWLLGKLSLYTLSKLTGAMPKGCAVNEYYPSTDIVFAGVITLTVVAQFLSLSGGVGRVYRSFFRLVVYFL